MAQTLSFTECPTIVWRIRDFRKMLRVEAENFFTFNGRKIQLCLTLETGINVDGDHFVMHADEMFYLVGGGGQGSFLIKVCIRDKFQQNQFVEITEIPDSIQGCLQIWRVKRSDLISRYGELIKDDVVTFVCTTMFSEVQLNIMRMQKASCTDADTRCLRALSEDMHTAFERSHLTDVIFQCHDKNVFAHRAILCARSSVFSAMFEHPMSEKRSGVVNLTGVDSKIWISFLTFVYSGQLDVASVKMASAVYSLGDQYDIGSLKRRCAEYIAQHLCKENVFLYAEMADAHHDSYFMDKIMDYISKNDELLKDSVWIDFWKEKPNIAFKIYKLYVGKDSTQMTAL